MKLKTLGLFVILAMGAVALPASANTVGAHAGVFAGEAKVGKVGSCNNDGSTPVAVSSGGIGLLPDLLNPPKNAWYSIDAPGSVIDATHGIGDLKLCGQLTAPGQGDADGPGPLPFVDVKGLTGVGASCTATKGHDGKGKASLPGVPGVTTPQDIWVKNLGWKATVGGTFVVSGDADSTGAKTKKTDLLVAAVQALSEGAVLGCINKTLGDKDNVQPFTVVAAYVIVPNAGGNTAKKGPKK